ncbi:adenylate kinase [Novipirellula aureliae]|uniref:Adenylate kinase n=1 Tax=Novipirellula aureliae TaxID=2527966 RepID=A0A5C6EEI1_9BACT|nr:adenylate kinase [Novipirellula aureliae]TWU45956.1 adenylate kinase [Novipirellula aureliae]
MRIVFIGPPGAGKGTQCKRLAKLLHAAHLSTGDMLRSVDRHSDLGRRIAGYIDDGGFAPDELIMEIVTARLAEIDYNKSCLFDGFPRTLRQAEMFDEILASQNSQIDLVINLEVDRDELVSRLLDRAKVEHRLDDNLSAISTRLQIYSTVTVPLLAYYGEKGIVKTIDATASADIVFERVKACVLGHSGDRPR